jgi:hypothetical protein
MTTTKDDDKAELLNRVAQDQQEAIQSQALYLPKVQGEFKGLGQSATKEFLKWAASGVVSKIAGTAIGGPILDFFGLGDKDLTKYQEQIKSQLADLSSELNKGMTVLQQGIGEIKSAVTAISVDVKDQKLQTALQMYTPNKNRINQNFMSFANAIAGAASNDRATSDRSIKSIYDLLQITNMNTISEALLNIHDQFYGSGQLTGIIEYQVDVCYNAVNKWAAVPSNLFIFKVTPGFMDYSKILRDSSAVMCDELKNSVLPNLKAVLAVQLQGIALLAHAWSGTEQEPQLKVHTQNLLAQITKIRGLYTAMTATAKYDRFVQETLTAFAKPPAQEVFDQYVEHLEQPTGNVGSGNLRYWRFAKPPFGIDWVSWGHPTQVVRPYGTFHKPWDGEEPTMMSGSAQSCHWMCVIKMPINYGGINQIIHIGSITGEKAPHHFYTGVKGEITKSGTPRQIIYDPRNTPIPYPHTYIQPPPKEFADLVKQLESPPV